MHDVFISYSSKDQKIADAIVNILETRRVKCWIAYRDAEVGDDYAGSIVRAIKNCTVCVLIFSSDSNQSKHVLNEVNSCVNYGKPIIPFRIADVLMKESLEYYLGRTHWLDALTTPIEEHINKLADILDALMKRESQEHTKIHAEKSGEPAQVNTSETRMAKYDELITLGYNTEKIAIQLVENYYINCRGKVDDNAGSPTQWGEFVQNSTETFRYLLNGENKIVGGWSIIALNKEVFIRAKQGIVLEKEINYDLSELIAFPGFYYGYFVGFSILPDYRNMANYQKLWLSFYGQIEEYAINKIFFKEWCINVISPEIEQVMKKLGLTHIADNQSYGKIYHQYFIPLPNNPILNDFPKLKQLYSEIKESDE